MAYLKETTINGDLVISGKLYIATATTSGYAPGKAYKAPPLIYAGTSSTKTSNTTSVKMLTYYHDTSGKAYFWTTL